jgi:rhodanese-related sulfurtransferase/predicted transcriptional regulator
MDSVPNGYPAGVPRTADTAEVQRLIADGAQLVDVLPAETFKREHLPDAISIPLAEIDTAPERLDRTRPIVVYCYDYECDLSPRAACRLEQLGFDVYDYVASKTAWLAEGLHGEGLLRDDQRVAAVTRHDVPRIAPDAKLGELEAIIGEWEVAVVVSESKVVVGVVRAEAVGTADTVTVDAVMQTAPATVRPSISIRELAQSMDGDGQRHVLVTTLGGKLIGLVRRTDLDA